MPVSAADIEVAYERTAGYVRWTPALEVAPEPLDTLGRLVIKPEQLQHTGSFKP